MIVVSRVIKMAAVNYFKAEVSWRRKVAVSQVTQDGSRRFFYNGGRSKKDALVVMTAIDFFMTEVGQRRTRY